MNVLEHFRIRIEPRIFDNFEATATKGQPRMLTMDETIYTEEEAVDLIRRYFRAFAEMEK